MMPGRPIDQDIRRDPGGSIDFDFYRVRATALRSQAMRDGRTIRAACAGVLTIVGALTVIALIANPVVPTPSASAVAVATARNAAK
jgi:hypothetical protein